MHVGNILSDGVHAGLLVEHHNVLLHPHSCENSHLKLFYLVATLLTALRVFLYLRNHRGVKMHPVVLPSHHNET